MLLSKKSQTIDWKNVSNTSEFYRFLEKYNRDSNVAESVLKFKNEISQMKLISNKNITPYEYNAPIKGLNN